MEQGKIKSVKYNFMMNLILTVSSIIFPLITFPYVSRILLAEGTGIVAFVTSITTYFTMFASLGIPTYGIRACAAVRDDKEKLSKVTLELFIINLCTTLLTLIVFIACIFLVPKFALQKELFFINAVSLLLNAFGVNWFYSAIEQYKYITVRSLIFKAISVVLIFIFVKSFNDYVYYGAALVFATVGSNVLNFINLRKFVDFKLVDHIDFKQHMTPVLIFFATSAATSVYTNLDVIMLGFMQGEIDVGYYNAAIKMKNVLISIVVSLGTVLLPRLSYLVNAEKIDDFKNAIKKSVNFTCLISFPLVNFFVAFAGITILLLSGPTFGESVVPMKLLMPTVLLIGLSNTTGLQVLVPLGKENQLLISILVGAVVDFILNLVLINSYGATGAALSTLIAEVLVLAVQCYFLRRHFVESVKNVSFLKILIACAVSTAVALLVSKFVFGLVPNIIYFIIIAFVYFGVYSLLILLEKEKLVYEDILPTIKRFKL